MVKEIPDALPSLVGDKKLISQVLINIISNAIKYTIDGRIILEIKEKYNEWVFNVKDTGIGIAKKDFDLVFREFHRIESSYVNSVQGTGLGLPLTKRLINLHGGIISFSSVLGIGSTFTFTIPKELNEEFDVDLV